MSPRFATWREIVVVLLLLATGGWLMFGQPSVRTSARQSIPAANKISTNFAENLPLAFELNTGQADPRVKYMSRQGGAELLLTQRGTAIRFSDSRRLLRWKLVGANHHAAVNGRDPLPGVQNYLLGNNPANWHTNVPTFRKVRYEEIYPRTDLIFYGNRRALEYDFELAPGADPKLIRFSFAKPARLRLAQDGSLIVSVAGYQLTQRKPVIYQVENGARKVIDGRYRLIGTNTIGFEIAEYDRTKPLVIDPTLVFSTYLGGSGDDSGSSIARDASGNIYVAGSTTSTNFPAPGALFPNNKGATDIFVTKLDPTGSTITYSTYIGGTGIDRAGGITVDGDGNAYVVGRVGDTSTDFPTTAGSLAPTYRGGDFDGVVFKLNSAGNALVYSTFLGGEDNDSCEGIALDTSRNAYLVGGTRSNGFPVSAGAFQSFRTGDTDAYFTKLNAAGSAVMYSTLLGGTSTDRSSGVVVDVSGNAYIAGYSGSLDFPTQNAFQTFSGGSFDAFICKIDPNQSGAASLLFSTYLGGIADDKAYGIAIDSAANNIYVAGQSSSNNLPLLNPAQPAFGGLYDAFAARLSTAGAKIFTTYIGGSGDDRATGIAVNAAGEAYVTGFTSSTNFPTVSPLQIANAGGFDAFVTKLNPGGSVFIYSTYFGGSANESNSTTITATNPIALDPGNSAYITGYTSSTNFPVSSALQPASAGAQEAFIARIADVTPLADFSLSMSPGTRTVSPGGGTTYTITATPAGGFTGTISLAASGFSTDTTTSFSPASIVITDASAQSSTLTVNTTSGTPPGTYAPSVDATSGNLQHIASSQLIVSGSASANLTIFKTASPNPATALANLTYRLAISNQGPSPANNVVVTDTLPGAVNFVSAVPAQGSCSGTATVTCNVGAMNNGASVIVNITVAPQGAGQLSNTASVTATEPDTDTTNNSTTIQTIVGPPATGPSMLDANLSVGTVITGLSQPTSMAFLADKDFLVLEKNTGKVQRVVNGVVQSTVLDLAVNSNSERGLLGIALHPNFPATPYVYLYWTESATGIDTTDVAQVFLLGNRVDRFVWNGVTLTFDRNLIQLRAFQEDEGATPGSIIRRGNHNGGVIRFGPDGKLYILMGDNGRRGFLQNITTAVGPNGKDDAWGGPEPDDAHLTGVILRLNDDGTTPPDNPFYSVNSGLTGTAAVNVKKIFAYGVRNGFGMAFDPYTGNLWDQENGDDSFDEMNRIFPGANNGWIQVMGPSSRVGEFKQIETTYGNHDLQQLRWPPTNIADTPAAALARLYLLPGAQYNEPEFSWKYAIPAAPLGFVNGRGLGTQFEGDMFVGAARTFLYGGFLFRFRFNGPNRLHFNFNDDPRLIDRVADNNDKFDITESEQLLIGQNFGITTDIQTGPNGNLFVVSNTNGAVYEIAGKPPTLFTATLTGAQEIPPNNSSGGGTATLLLSPDEKTARVSLNFSGLSSAQTGAHIHGPAAPGASAPILFPLPNGNLSDFVIALTSTDVQDLKNGLLYINVHSSNFPNGEIRGQFGSAAGASSFQFNSAAFTASERTAKVPITVTRIGNTASAGTVSYATSNGTANAPDDYLSGTGTLNFAAGEAVKTFTITLTDDLFVEGNETINLTLMNPGGGSFLGSPNTATITIVDNDVPTNSAPELRADISGPAVNQLAAVDALLFTRDPFPTHTIANWWNYGADLNTRVMLFAGNLFLNSGDSSAAVVVNLVDANSQSFDIPAEDVRVVRDSELAQITFRLPNGVAAGACTVKVHKGSGPFSNTGTFRINP